jgi:Predicted membrane protein (DUF2079)
VAEANAASWPVRGLRRLAGSRLYGGFALVWRIGLALFALQLIGLLIYSVHVWRRFDLTSDFATFQQAWEQIATGHFSPYLSTFAYNYPSYGYPFWQSHFELLMWPLALLWYVCSSSLDLLVVQDLVLVGSGLAALRWGLELAERHWPERTRGAPWVGVGLLAVLLVNPWIYWAASYDFHFQPIACFFTLLAGRDIWAGRRRAWWWVAVVLLCGDVAATYIVALGIGALLAGRRTRRDGAVATAIGVAWLGVIGIVGSGKGSTLPASYGYLADGHVGNGLSGIIEIAKSLARHPTRVWRALHPRWPQIWKYIASTGTLGALSAVGLPMTLIVLGANGLNQSAVFIGADATFQSLAVVFATAVGAVMVATWLARRGRAGRLAAAVVGVAMVVQAVVVSAQWTSKAPDAFLLVSSATADQLGSVEHRIPSSAEVVVSQGVIGRFGGHEWVYPYLDAFQDGQTVPVQSKSVAFVFTDAGLESASAAATAAAEALVGQHLHATLIASGSGVVAYLWHPPAGTTTVTLPPASAAVPAAPSSATSPPPARLTSPSSAPGTASQPAASSTTGSSTTGPSTTTPTASPITSAGG